MVPSRRVEGLCRAGEETAPRAELPARTWTSVAPLPSAGRGGRWLLGPQRGGSWHPGGDAGGGLTDASCRDPGQTGEAVTHVRTGLGPGQGALQAGPGTGGQPPSLSSWPLAGTLDLPQNGGSEATARDASEQPKPLGQYRATTRHRQV